MELLVSGYGVSIWNEYKILKMNVGDGGIINATELCM
jgi:hypothetical protein